MKFNDRLFRHDFPNGLVLVADRMPWLQTAAFSLALPAGCRFDPPDRLGLCNLSCELAFRETETLDSHQLVESLDGLGCDYYSNTSVLCTFFGGALPASELYRALPVYADVAQHPRLDTRWLEESRLACLQEVEALEDDLAGKVLTRLRMKHYGDPWGRIPEGESGSVEKITIGEIGGFVDRRYRPGGAVLAVAGQFEFPRLCDAVGELFGGWEPGVADGGTSPAVAADSGHHIGFPSKQTHIGIAWPGLAWEDPEWHVARCAIGVLSDGMSSRLFREVRERRGLCYSVVASCHAVPGQGACFAYCGTTTEAAQQALDVIVAEIRRLSEGIREDELQRIKTQVRSGLIMQQESCRSRAGSMVSDVILLGRLRSVNELSERIQALTVGEVNRFLAAHPPGPFDLVTLGENPLELDRAVPSATA